MMRKKLLWWVSVTLAVVVVTFLLARHRYVLSSVQLEEAIMREIPPGSSKAQVVDFIQKRRPLFCDDLGSRVETRLSGLAENMIYKKDIILVFQFDAGGKLVSYSKKEFLTFF